MFEGIKSKLGFANNYDADDYDEFEEEVDEYGESREEYGTGYDSYEKESYHYDEYSTSRGGSYGGSGHPNLVSIEDVRANTQVPQSLSRDPLSARQSSYSSSNSGSSLPRYQSLGRSVERASDYLRSTDGSDVREDAPRTEGVDSLFTTTASNASSQSRSYDPYEAFEGAGTSSHNPTRSLSVMRPSSYGEVERIAKIIKAGDVVVLGLRTTPDQLAKRILDFSFGVSSALDASVDCIADKVFVIVRGCALTHDEKAALRDQGIL